MEDIVALLGRWESAARDVRERMYRVPALRERERWHSLWLLAQGWSVNKVTDLLERDPPHDREVPDRVCQCAPVPSPSSRPVTAPALDPDAQAKVKLAVQATPSEVGINLAGWNWKVVREFIETHCGLRRSRSSCLRYLHRLAFVCKRSKKRLLKVDEAKRAAFVAEYTALLAEAKSFFADEAHFRADGGGPPGACGRSGCSRATRPWWTQPTLAGGRRRATTRPSAWKPGRSSTWR